MAARRGAHAWLCADPGCCSRGDARCDGEVVPDRDRNADHGIRERHGVWERHGQRADPTRWRRSRRTRQLHYDPQITDGLLRLDDAPEAIASHVANHVANHVASVTQNF